MVFKYLCKRPPSDEGSHFLNSIFVVIKEKDELYILSLESATSVKKPINPLRVVYHPVSCLLDHYINLWMTAMVQMTATNRLAEIRKDQWHWLVTKTSNCYLYYILWFVLDRLMPYSFISDDFDFKSTVCANG